MIHRFIITNSCALAYSKPGIKITRIDSTWGIVDGLYYHPHDSFEYSSYSKSIKKKIRCKYEFLDVDENGKWITIQAGHNIDWKQSLKNSEIRDISEYTQKIANYIGKPVTVMYFVGVFKETGYPTILPWYYTTEEITDSTEKFSEVIFSQKKIQITNKNDFENIKNIISQLKENNKISVQLKLIPDLLRDKEFIEVIGRFFCEENIPIEIEGSILSHPFYILKKQNAKVKVSNLLDPDYSEGQNFFKLVRDKIPVTIREKGEHVNSCKIINSQEVLELLRQKLIEEAFESFWETNDDNLILELADLFEVIRGIVKLFGKDINLIINIADNKKREKGGFEEGVFLANTRQKSLFTIIDNTGTSNVLFNYIDENVNVIEKQKIPSHQRSVIKGNTLKIPLIPFIKNSKYNNKRVEIVEINKSTEYRIEFSVGNISIQILEKIKSDPFQLKLFDDLI